MKPFALITVCLFLTLLLPNMGFSSDRYYVNGRYGNDNNSCSSPDRPCKTIKAALEKAPDVAFIRISRGTYEEQKMSILAHRRITFRGGWNNDFTSQTCRAGDTTIIASDYQGFGSAFLSIFLNNNGESATMDLQCLTLQPATNSGYPKVISIITDNGATAQLKMDHTRVTGFTGDPVVLLSSQTNATITATLTRTKIDHNRPSGHLLTMTSGSNSTVELTLNKVWMNNNILVAYKAALSAVSTSSGTTKTSIVNSILAANDNEGISISSGDQSTNTLTVSNSTLTDNLRHEIHLNAQKSSTLSVTVTDSILKNADSRWSDILLHAEDSAKITFHANYSILGDHEKEQLDTSTIDFISNNEVHGDLLLNSTYHLKKGSVAIDAGICGMYLLPPNPIYIPLAPLDDIDGDKRPSNNGKLFGCDIGADEFNPFSWPLFLPAIVHQQTDPSIIAR